jgi:hypothetical protein
MKALDIIVSTALILLVSIQANATPPSASKPSKVQYPAMHQRICDMAAEKAQSITSATIANRTLDAMPEVLAQTLPDSIERKLMLDVFQRPFLVTSVLIESASAGAMTLPPDEAKAALKDIVDFAYTYVRSQCLAVLVKPEASKPK